MGQGRDLRRALYWERKRVIDFETDSFGDNRDKMKDVFP